MLVYYGSHKKLIHEIKFHQDEPKYCLPNITFPRFSKIFSSCKVICILIWWKFLCVSLCYFWSGCFVLTTCSPTIYKWYYLNLSHLSLILILLILFLRNTIIWENFQVFAPPPRFVFYNWSIIFITTIIIIVTIFLHLIYFYLCKLFLSSSIVMIS